MIRELEEVKKFYSCRYDRTFKEVFLNPNNSDLLKALLEFILKIKIDKFVSKDIIFRI